MATSTPRSKPKLSLQVESLKHEDAKRKNIPTTECQVGLKGEEVIK